MLMEQIDFVDEILGEQEASNHKLENLANKHEKLRKAIFERLSQQQKRIDEMQTSIDLLFMQQTIIDEA